MRSKNQREIQQNFVAMLKYAICTLGIIFAIPVLTIGVLAFYLPITSSGIGYLSGSVLLATGLILSPVARRLSTLLTIAGVLIIAVVAGTRLRLANQDMNSAIRMIALPRGNESYWISYLIDEQDSLIFGETFFHFMGGDSRREHQDLPSALHTAYSEMRAVQRLFPSPVAGTYLQLQGATRFDTVIIEPEVNHLPEFAVVFLHGFMGNVTAQCWEIAQAVKTFGGVTLCPSTGWRGDWWQPQGEAILRATFEYLRERGIQRFYLGGFSNGGSGISRLAPKLKNETGLKGLIFIDGIHNAVDIRETNLPVLIIQGTQDERMLASQARQIAAEIGALATYAELNSDHYLIMKQPRLVREALAQWLERFEERKYAASQY